MARRGGYSVLRIILLGIAIFPILVLCFYFTSRPLFEREAFESRDAAVLRAHDVMARAWPGTTYAVEPVANGRFSVVSEWLSLPYASVDVFKDHGQWVVSQEVTTGVGRRVQLLLLAVSALGLGVCVESAVRRRRASKANHLIGSDE